MKEKFRDEGTISPLPLYKNIITWILRLAVGGIFIFSGFVKGIDPWGTLYKMQDYVNVMPLPALSDGVLLTGVFLLFALEFLTGVFLVTGSFRRGAPILVMLFMVGMLPLTFWIALKSPVADCGCFGDAWIISNWATFWKNVAITAAAVWLIIYNRRVHWLVTPALQWLLFCISAIYIIAAGVVGYSVQPLIDFRPYPVGSLLTKADADNSSEHFTFIYEKEGVQKEFSETDTLPDEADGWTFVDRKAVAAPKDNANDMKTAGDFHIWTEDGDTDMTSDAIGSREGKRLILMVPDLSEVSIAPTWKINALKKWAEAHDTDFIAVMAGSPEEIANWKDLSLTDYPIYTAEDTSIKEVARGNPSVVYTEDGLIKWKSTLSAIPGEDTLDSPQTTDASMLHLYLTDRAKEVTAIYLCMIAVLVMLSFTQKISWRRLFTGGKSRKKGENPSKGDDKTVKNDDERVSDGDKAPRGE